MSELKELLKTVTNDIKVNKKRYIYYKEETGKIVKILNSIDQDNMDPYIEVEFDQVKEIFQGEKSTNHFKIEYDISIKQKNLKEVDNSNDVSINEYLYKIPYKNENNKTTNFSDDIFKPEYKEIWVDVWYDELEHLKGQHVWVNNTVYRILKDQDKNTKFDNKNAEVIIESVKLFDDDNKHLNFNVNIKNKDLILKNNKVYSIQNFDNIQMNDELMIKKDNKNQKWIFKINNKIRKQLMNDLIQSDDHISFSVTKKDDPNILFKFFKIKIRDLVVNNAIDVNFDDAAESEMEDFSIYTYKYFSSYLCETINE